MHRRSLPINAWLMLAAGAVAFAFLLGSYLVHRGTQNSAESISRVENRFEPLVRLALDLENAVGTFDRAVLGYLKFDTPANAAAVLGASRTLVATLAEYDRIADPPAAAASDGELRHQLAAFHRDGLMLMELQNQRSRALRSHREAIDALRGRIASAGASGLPVGENVFARRSLSELARAADAVRDRAEEQLTENGRGRVERAGDVERAERAFREVLDSHAPELERSPGRVWLELAREDFARAVAQRRAVIRLDEMIEKSRQEFAAAAARIQEQVHADLQEPAWRALGAAARSARLTVEDTERMLGVVSAGMLFVILCVAVLTAQGITVPVRRLMAGTRRLARGKLDARVERGGVRELDELALAFNHMAEQLYASQRALRDYQAELEERVAARTRQLRHLAHHDPLTDLPNRRKLFAFLSSALEQARAAGRHAAVLFIDLDNFKTINDSLGHEFGDRVLKGIGDRLRTLAQEGEFVARLGGDEFTLVLRDVKDPEDVKARVERVVAAFQRPLAVERRELLVGVSIGVAVFPDHAMDAEALLRAADSALFRAKELGRNRYCVYSPELLQAAASRFRTEQALRKAIEADELLLHFQPEVSLATLETTVVEALLRWRRPDGTLLSAGQFLDVAQQSGLILELNEWVLRAAGATLREWRAGAWPQARIAINASSQQFLTGNFVGVVERMLRTSGLPPECLELELTENVLQTGSVTIEALHALRLLGVTVALDDFGAGFSSLTSLERLPLDRVKIDRGLVAAVDSSPRAAAIVRSIISLCRSLGLQVTAEGVERPAQLDLLLSCGDVHVQGYLIARPAAADAMLEFVRGASSHLATLRAKVGESRAQADSAFDGTVAILRPRR